MGDGGFEPPKPKQQIYSLSPLTTREISHILMNRRKCFITLRLLNIPYPARFVNSFFSFFLLFFCKFRRKRNRSFNLYKIGLLVICFIDRFHIIFTFSSQFIWYTEAEIALEKSGAVSKGKEMEKKKGVFYEHENSGRSAG